MGFCTKCGHRLDPDARFCTNCGARLPAPGSSTPAQQTSQQAPHDPTLAAWPERDHRETGPVQPSPWPPRETGFADDVASQQAALSRPPSRHLRATLIAVGAAAVAAAGVVVGLLVVGHHPGSAATAGKSSSLSARTTPPASTSPPTSPTPSPTPSATGTASPSATPTPTPGSVRIGPPAAGQADAGKVTAFLSQYFAAIKARNYQAYTSLFEPNAEPNQTAAQFKNGYRSTTDSREELVSLTPGTAGLAATITFDSHQSPADSATHTACTAWEITLYLQPSGSSYLIGKPPAGYSPSDRPC
jgi:zinc-ribbon domain